MADPILERIHELPVAASWNGFFPQDKPGGPTECVSVATVEARLELDGFVRTAMLVAGYQPLENQRVSTTDSPAFNRLVLTEDGDGVSGANICALVLDSSEPVFAFKKEAGSSQNKYWNIGVNAGDWGPSFYHINDAQTLKTPVWRTKFNTTTGRIEFTLGFSGLADTIVSGAFKIGSLAGTLIGTAGNVSALSGTELVLGNGTTIPQSTFATGGPYQPLDSDLTAIAALATTPFGRSLLTQVDAAAARNAIGALAASLKGSANGVAELDATGKVPATQLHSSLALGETSATAYRGDLGKTAYDHSQSTGNPHGLTRADIGAHPQENQLLSTGNGVQFYSLELNGDGFELGTAALSIDSAQPIIAFRSTGADPDKRRWNLGFSGNEFGLFHYPDAEDSGRRSWSVYPNLTSGKIEFRFGDVGDVDVFVPWNGNGMLKFVEADDFGSKLVPAVAGVDYALPTEPEPTPLWPKVLWDDAGYPQFSLPASLSSLLSENVPTRTIPANTWTEGMTLTFEFEGIKRGATTNFALEFFIGPEGVYTTPYYIPASAQFPAGTMRFKTRVVIKCLSTGASGQFEYSLETTKGAASDGSTVYNYVTSESLLATIDTTVARVIDFVGVNGSGSSMIGLHSHCVMTIPGAGSGFVGVGAGGGSSLPMVVGSDGDLVYIHPTGQKLFNGNFLYSWTYQGGGDYSNLTVDSTTETTIFDQTTAGRNGLFPILSPGYLLGKGPIWVRVRGGYGVIGANPVLTVRVYMGATVVGTKNIDLSAFTRTTENMGFGLLFWIEPINAVSPGTSLRLRTHHYGQVSKGLADSAGSFLLSEDETYSNIDGTAAQNIKVTAQWSALGSQTWAFFDGIEVYR